MIRAEDISAEHIKSGIGGYKKKATQEYVEGIRNEYDALYRENQELKEKLSVLSEGVQYYKNIESSLQKALVLAEKTTSETVHAAEVKAEAMEREAKAKAELVTREAKMKAEECEKEANRKANTMIKEAKMQVETAIVEGNAELSRIHSQIMTLVQQYEQYKSQYKQLALAQMNVLESEAYNLDAPILKTLKQGLDKQGSKDNNQFHDIKHEYSVDEDVFNPIPTPSSNMENETRNKEEKQVYIDGRGEVVEVHEFKEMSMSDNYKDPFADDETDLQNSDENSKSANKDNFETSNPDEFFSFFEPKNEKSVHSFDESDEDLQKKDVSNNFDTPETKNVYSENVSNIAEEQESGFDNFINSKEDNENYAKEYNSSKENTSNFTDSFDGTIDFASDFSKKYDNSGDLASITLDKKIEDTIHAFKGNEPVDGNNVLSDNNIKDDENELRRIEREQLERLQKEENAQKELALNGYNNYQSGIEVKKIEYPFSEAKAFDEEIDIFKENKHSFEETDYLSQLHQKDKEDEPVSLETFRNMGQEDKKVFSEMTMNGSESFENNTNANSFEQTVINNNIQKNTDYKENDTVKDTLGYANAGVVHSFSPDALEALGKDANTDARNSLTREMESPHSYSSSSSDEKRSFKSFSDFEQELED